MAAENEPPKGVQQAAEKVRHEADKATHETVERGKGFLADQKGSAANNFIGIADALRHTARNLKDRNQGSTAWYADRSADYLERFAKDLRDHDVDTLINRVSDFARHQPGVFLGGAVTAGFLLSRFLKASSNREESASAATPVSRETVH